MIKVSSFSDIIVQDYPFAQNLKDEVVPLLEDYPDYQGRNTNIKATMTEWNWGSDIPQVTRFKGYVFNEIAKFAVCTFIWKNFWGNVYRKGDYGISHDHVPSYSSFVYFVKAKWYYSPLVFTDSGKKIRPKEGRLIIFPSYLKHHVPMHRYSEQRITLSGNLVYSA